jgi:hypothetical protein
VLLYAVRQRVMKGPLRAPIYVAIALLVAAGLIPIIYSFIHYKALERRGAL